VRKPIANAQFSLLNQLKMTTADVIRTAILIISMLPIQSRLKPRLSLDNCEQAFKGMTATNNKINQILNWTVSMVWPITRRAIAEYISEVSIFIWRSSSYSCFTCSWLLYQFQSSTDLVLNDISLVSGSGSTIVVKDFGQFYASNTWCVGYSCFSAY